MIVILYISIYDKFFFGTYVLENLGKFMYETMQDV